MFTGLSTSTLYDSSLRRNIPSYTAITISTTGDWLSKSGLYPRRLLSTTVPSTMLFKSLRMLLWKKDSLLCGLWWFDWLGKKTSGSAGWHKNNEFGESGILSIYHHLRLCLCVRSNELGWFTSCCSDSFRCWIPRGRD